MYVKRYLKLWTSLPHKVNKIPKSPYWTEIAWLLKTTQEQQTPVFLDAYSCNVKAGSTKVEDKIFFDKVSLQQTKMKLAFFVCLQKKNIPFARVHITKPNMQSIAFQTCTAT